MSKIDIYTGLVLGIFILFVFVVINIFVHRNEQNEKQERDRYVRSLNYSFCGKIDRMEEFKQKWGYGYIYCTLDSGVLMDTSVEDSLQTTLQYYDKILFIVTNSVGVQVKIRVPGILTYEKGDMICVAPGADKLMHINQKADTLFTGISDCLEVRH